MATIRAKYAGTCRKCGGSFAPGASIEWSKGAGSTHVTCPAKAAATPPAPVAKVDLAGAPFEVWEKWEPCKRPALDRQLAAVVGETRRYTLGPAARTVKGSAAVPPFAGYKRLPYQTCKCGAAPQVPCVDGCDGVTGAAPGRPATPAREEPIPEAKRRERLPKCRAGATAEAHEGVYVVVGAGRWHFQSSEDNEDMGDMQGANWSGTLYLRAATPEEAAKDAAERVAASMPEIVLALGNALNVVAKRQAETAMAAAAERPGYARAAIDYSSALDLTPEDVELRKATRRELWRGLGLDSSYVATWTWRGQEVFESYKYIYDYDQPTCYSGPAELVERAAVAQSMVMLGYDIQRAVRRMEAAA